MGTPDAHNGAGNAALRDEDYEGAVGCYSQGLAECTETELRAILLSNRSSALAHLGRWESALEDSLACLRERPTWSRSHACHGAALEGLGRVVQALDAFETAERLDPDNSELSSICAELRLKILASRAAAPSLSSHETSLSPQLLEHKWNPSSSGTATGPAENAQGGSATLLQDATLTVAAGRLRGPCHEDNTHSDLETAYMGPGFGNSKARTDRRGGVGMALAFNKNDSLSGQGNIIVDGLTPWSPLRDSGVTIGDRLVSVDGSNVTAVPFEVVQKLVRGPPGSPVHLAFRRSLLSASSSSPQTNNADFGVTVERVLPLASPQAPVSMRLAPAELDGLRPCHKSVPLHTTVDLDDASQIRQMGSGGAVLPMPVRDAVGALVRTPADPVLSPDMSEATLAPLRDELRASGQVGLEHDLRAFYMRVAPGEPAETAAAWVRELSETYKDDLEMLNASLLVKYKTCLPVAAEAWARVEERARLLDQYSMLHQRVTALERELALARQPGRGSATKDERAVSQVELISASMDLTTCEAAPALSKDRQVELARVASSQREQEMAQVQKSADTWTAEVERQQVEAEEALAQTRSDLYERVAANRERLTVLHKEQTAADSLCAAASAVTAQAGREGESGLEAHSPNEEQESAADIDVGKVNCDIDEPKVVNPKAGEQVSLERLVAGNLEQTKTVTQLQQENQRLMAECDNLRGQLRRAHQRLEHFESQSRPGETGTQGELMADSFKMPTDQPPLPSATQSSEPPISLPVDSRGGDFVAGTNRHSHFGVDQNMGNHDDTLSMNGWVTETVNGQTLYVNHREKRFSWVHPSQIDGLEDTASAQSTAPNAARNMAPSYTVEATRGRATSPETHRPIQNSRAGVTVTVPMSSLGR